MNFIFFIDSGLDKIISVGVEKINKSSNLKA